MKIIILLCILLTFCSSQGNFYQTLQAEAAKSNGGIPGNFGQYVNSISVKVASVSNSINRNTLDSILNFFKACSAANTPGTNTYNNYAITGMTGVYIKGVGGIYFEGNDAKFSYIEGRALRDVQGRIQGIIDISASFIISPQMNILEYILLICCFYY